MSVRKADFAGSWYPDTENGCLQMFSEFEKSCVPLPDSIDRPLGGIVPHAGWVFSGRIAYNVIQALAQAGGEPTVVLFGGHLHPSSPIAVMTHGDFWTPLGLIPTDQELASAICDLPHGPRRISPEHHSPDNTVELQAPLIKHLLPQARMVVINAPPREETLDLAGAIADLADKLDRRVIALGSTDLTHYGPNYGWAPQGHGDEALAWVKEVNDPRFIELIRGMDPMGAIDEALKSSNACCPGAAAAATELARKQGASEGHLLTYATSADIRPDSSFVGYAGIVF